MAGFRDTVIRLKELVEAALPSYKYTKQDVFTLAESMPSGFDRTFAIVHPLGQKVTHAVSNRVQSMHNVTIELAREFAGGTANRYDALSITEDLEADAMLVQEQIDYPANWDYSNTGLILLTIEESDIEAEDNIIVYRVNAELTIRRNSTHSEVA